MPRYHFIIGDEIDPEGVELPDLADAKRQAIKTFGAMISDEAEGFWDRADWTMTVSDDGGLTLFQLCIFGKETAATTGFARQAKA